MLALTINMPMWFAIGVITLAAISTVLSILILSMRIILIRMESKNKKIMDLFAREFPQLKKQLHDSSKSKKDYIGIY